MVFLFCSSHDLILRRPGLFHNFLTSLRVQLHQAPKDFFTDEITSDNFLRLSLIRLSRHVDQALAIVSSGRRKVSPSHKNKFEMLKRRKKTFYEFLQERFRIAVRIYEEGQPWPSRMWDQGEEEHPKSKKVAAFAERGKMLLEDELVYQESEASEAAERVNPGARERAFERQFAANNTDAEAHKTDEDQGGSEILDSMGDETRSSMPTKLAIEKFFGIPQKKTHANTSDGAPLSPASNGKISLMTNISNTTRNSSREFYCFGARKVEYMTELDLSQDGDDEGDESYAMVDATSPNLTLYCDDANSPTSRFVLSKLQDAKLVCRIAPRNESLSLEDQYRAYDKVWKLDQSVMKEGPFQSLQQLSNQSTPSYGTNYSKFDTWGISSDEDDDDDEEEEEEEERQQQEGENLETQKKDKRDVGDEESEKQGHEGGEEQGASLCGRCYLRPATLEVRTDGGVILEEICYRCHVAPPRMNWMLPEEKRSKVPDPAKDLNKGGYADVEIETMSDD
eukprot:766055-Hanusia_phi.AAC.11